MMTLTELFNTITVLSTEVLENQMLVQGYVVIAVLAAIALASFVLFLICKSIDADSWQTVTVAVICLGFSLATLLAPKFVPFLKPSQIQITAHVPQDVAITDLTEYFTIVSVDSFNDEHIATLKTNKDLDTYEEVMTYLQDIL